MGSKAGERETLRPGQRVERLREAADARDWDLLRSLCHPDARLVLRMTEGTALALDDALAVLRADAEAGAYEPTHYYISASLPGQRTNPASRPSNHARDERSCAAGAARPREHPRRTAQPRSRWRPR